MKDRVVQHPHRYQLVPVSGQSDTYDIIAKPGTITEAGTPINKATLLSDETAALYGLTGEDATVDGALAIIPHGYQSAEKLHGNVVYTDSMSKGATVQKNIAIGQGKKFGMMVIRVQDMTASSSTAPGILVLFTTNNLYTKAVGSDGAAASNGMGGAICRRQFGSITSTRGTSTGFGVGATGDTSIAIQDVFINESNIQITFKSVGNSSALNCEIDWEVW